ncbi:MAG: hypothetical protein MUE67_04760 [Anaerolineales bacterium]|nr:hypothetical protein [Anaerolineales bacterium]
MDRAGEIDVIGVQPGDDLAGGSPEALINCLSLTPVWFRDPPGQAVGVPLDDCRAFIGGGAIHNAIFQLDAILLKDRLDGLFQEGGLII